MKIITFWVLLLFPIFCFSQNQKNTKLSPSLSINWEQFMSRHDLVSEVLPLQWNEGSFIGNGHLGMMVFATLEDNRIDFHIGRQDVTDHRKAPDKKTSMGVVGATVMYDYSRLDIGRLALRPAGKIISGTMRLDLWNAEIRANIITSLGTISFRAFVPYNDMVQIIEVQSTEKNERIPAPYKWEFLPGYSQSPRVIVKGKPADYIFNPEPTVFTQNDTSICVQSLIAGGDYATAWYDKKSKKANTSTLYLSTANEVPASGLSKTVAIQNISKAISKPISRVEKNHRDWWHNFYQQSFVSVPDVQTESFYWIQLYKMGTCSRPDGPAVDLNGPYFRVTQWPGLWWNLNVQLTYWIVYESNHLEMGENFNTLIDNYFDNLCNSIEDTKLGDLAWSLHNYWLQYSYDGNWKAIQEKWVPKAKVLMEKYEKMQVRDSLGRIGLAPMGSPEFHAFAVFPNTNYNLAIMRWLLNTLIETNEKANTNQKDVAKWKQMLNDIIPYPVDANGLKIASNQSLDISHRHYSHLLGLYPFFQFNPDNDEDRALLMKSLLHWHKIQNGRGLAGYSYTGAASMYAALGEGNKAYDALKFLFNQKIKMSQLASNTFYTELDGKNPVIETPLSAAASIMEFLMQSWGNKIRIFPAVPESWKEATFSNLRAQGGFLVGAVRANSQTQWVHVKSLAGEPCVIKVLGWDAAYQVSKGAKYKIKALGNNEFSIDLKKGDEIIISNQPKLNQVIINQVNYNLPEQNLYGVKTGKQIPKNQNYIEKLQE